MRFVKPFRAVFLLQALEREHDKIVGTIETSEDERRLWDHIVRINILLKRWLLQIEQQFCMGTNDKKHPGIKRVGDKASYPFG